MGTSSYESGVSSCEFRILGTRVHPIEMEDVLDHMEGWVRSPERGRFIVASGMHGLMEAHRDPRVWTILNRADLYVVDGFSLLWLARHRGFRLRQRVCGADLLMAFCARASREGYRVFFYGDTEAVLSRLCERLANDYPGLRVAGTYAPPFRPMTQEEDEEVVRLITLAAPDVIWVGLGLPKQESWIIEHRDRLDVPVFVGVGAAFKFVGGTVRRAPRWVGEHGLEWIWRFVHEPRRLWRRALLDVPTFLWLVFLEGLGVLNTHRADRAA